jgi:hypothetical protein
MSHHSSIVLTKCWYLLEISTKSRKIKDIGKYYPKTKSVRTAALYIRKQLTRHERDLLFCREPATYTRASFTIRRRSTRK